MKRDAFSSSLLGGSRPADQRRRGFTLLELLTVMSIIAILISLGAVGINKIGKGQGVTSGLTLGEGLLAQARTLAMNENAPARLVIHGDLNDQDPVEQERYRRMMMVVYRETDNEGRILPGWKRFGTPTFLPEGVYYAAELSQADMRGGGMLPMERHQLSAQPGDQRLCHFYEFNGQGVCATPGAGFIVESGNRPPGQVRPLLGGRRDLGGFVVLRNGGATYIRDIERLGAVGTQ
jgi:prepilin-type N-terminal cleavage/methylation domain-containing protein